MAVAWAPDDRTISVTPTEHWAPDTFHTVTIAPGALAQTGRPLTRPVRASFLTRPQTTASLAVTAPVGKRIAAETTFSIVFDRPVDPASARTGIALVPEVRGSLERTAAADGGDRYVFTPDSPLASGTRYRLLVRGVRDEDGLVVADATLPVRVVTAPEVERMRPATRSKDVPRDTRITVRFTRPMDRASTRAALTVEVEGRGVPGAVRFTDDDTVLVFEPERRFAYGSKVAVRVGTTARSAEGAALADGLDASFRVAPKPRPAPEPARGGSGDTRTGGGGGSAGSGSWIAVERYYLDLMNCTRTGGWVTASGTCRGPGGRDVAPLKLSSGISSKVARPYARVLAKRGACSHFIGGDPGDRLRKAGYTSHRWAENLGCRSGNAYAAVLGSHRFFQDEKPYNGGHYRNMMSAKYDRVGIGVWVAGGQVRLVVDFYHP